VTCRVAETENALETETLLESEAVADSEIDILDVAVRGEEGVVHDGGEVVGAGAANAQANAMSRAEYTRIKNSFPDALENLYTDGRNYFEVGPDGTVDTMDLTQMRVTLEATYNMSPVRPKHGACPLLTMAMEYIRRNKKVDSVAPLFFRPRFVEDRLGNKFLNNSRRKLVTRFDGKVEKFGDGFPVIADLLNKQFHEKDVFWAFHAWLKYFWESCRAGSPKLGHIMIIAGPAQCGKTLLANAVVGQMFGGADDPSSYLTGQTNFNGSLAQSPVWALDDVVITGRDSSDIYTNIVKRVGANPTITVEAKYKDRSIPYEWGGRLIITLNDDPKSLWGLPNLDGTILDKLFILKASSGFTVPSALGYDVKDVIYDELPHFVAWVEDTPYHPGTKLDVGRSGGLVPFHDPEIMQVANDTSSEAVSMDLIKAGLDKFPFDGQKPVYLKSAEIYTRFLSDPEGCRVMQALFKDPKSFGRWFAVIAKANKLDGYSFKSVTKKTHGAVSRVWEIVRTVDIVNTLKL
jgi:hypothetical protein